MRDEEMAIGIMGILVGGPMFTIIVGMSLKAITRIVCHWRDSSLKARMVDRGMSPFEIEQVILAGRHDGAGRRPTRAMEVESPSKPPRAAAYH